jgi:hypothetical protein
MPYITNTDHNSGGNLSTLWTGVRIPKGSVLRLQLIANNNTSVSGLLVNLNVLKQ